MQFPSHLDFRLFNATFLSLFIFLVACSNKCDQQCPIEEEILPTTTEIPEKINSFTPKRIVDLHGIVIALEKYKRVKNMYPVSTSEGEGWDVLLSAAGDVNESWISGLVPNYLASLPINSAEKNIPGLGQYLYKSNGANYKLVAYRPDDCEYIKSKLPSIIDPRRDCSAYGFWTAGAVKW